MVQLIVFVIWLASFLASAVLEYAPHASLWFPPAAISFAALLVLGWRALPPLGLACLVSAALTNQIYNQGLSGVEIFWSGVVFACTHLGAYGLVALILRRLAWEASPLTTLRKVIVVLIGGAIASGFAAVLGAWGLTLTGMIPATEFVGLIAPWWIGDYAGLITLGPLVSVGLVYLASRFGMSVPAGIQYFSQGHGRYSLTGRSISKLLLLLGIGATVLVVASWVPGKETVLFLLFVAIIVQLWIVHTETELCALFGIASFSLLLVFATNLLQLSDQALMLQFVLISLAANSYLGLAVPSLYNDNRRLRNLLTHDVLTNAMTRAFFEDAARSGIDEARRRGESAALVMVDLDDLKGINDRQGHAAGDDALKLLVSVCRKHLKSGELLGRLSGDEFAMYLPRASQGVAMEKVRAIKARLSAHGGSVGASFGIAALGNGLLNYDDLLAAADREMYRNKR